MALPEVFWTSLFILIAIGILIFFGLMVRKSLKGDGGCSCAETGSGMKKRESCSENERHGCENCCSCTVNNPYKKV